VAGGGSSRKCSRADLSRSLRKGDGKERRLYERYTVVHYQTDGANRKRQRDYFSSLEDARFEAQRIAAAIANGESDILKLKSADRESYLHATGELKPLGIPLHVAISEYVAARKHAGAGLITAAKEYAQRHALVPVRKTVAEVVQELLDAKEQDGMSLRYRQSLRSHLNRFADHFGMNISTVTAAQIEDWLRSLKRGPRTRNNIRLSVVTLFNFARARGYLPKSITTEAEHVAKAKDRGGDIEIFRPKQLADLLNAGDEEAKRYVALGAFTGLRAAELIRLEWEDINFARGHIHVAKAKAKTATRRLVPIQPNLAAWLAPYRLRKKGLVFPSEKAAGRAIAQARMPALNGQTMFCDTATPRIVWRSVRTPRASRSKWATAHRCCSAIIASSWMKKMLRIGSTSFRLKLPRKRSFHFAGRDETPTLSSMSSCVAARSFCVAGGSDARRVFPRFQASGR
jgi:integrase